MQRRWRVDRRKNNRCDVMENFNVQLALGLEIE